MTYPRRRNDANIIRTGYAARLRAAVQGDERLTRWLDLNAVDVEVVARGVQTAPRATRAGCEPNPLCLTTAPLYDSEGRRYAVQYTVLRTRLDGSGPVHTSNLPTTFAPDRSYPTDFQARDLSSPTESSKIRRIATNLDPDRVLWAHSDPTLGPPVVWHDGSRYYVLGGNGRTLAILMAPDERYQDYIDKLSSKWPALFRERPPAHNGERDILVRVVTADDGTPLDLPAAVKLAGASQESTAAAESPLGRALSVIRGLGITDAGALPAIRWDNVVTVDTVAEFESRNPAFMRALRERMDPAKRDAYQQASKAAELVRQVMVGFLPAEIRAQGFGDEATEEALLAALPLMISLDGLIKQGEVKPQWSLIDKLPDAVALYRVVQRKRIALQKIPDLLEREAEQGRLGEAETLLSGIHLLGFYLGIAIYKASRTKDPGETVNLVLRPYYAAALADAPGQFAMFGGGKAIEPAAVLASALGLRLPAKLPPGVRRNGSKRHNPDAGSTDPVAEMRKLLAYLEAGPSYVEWPLPAAAQMAVGLGYAHIMQQGRADQQLRRIALADKGAQWLSFTRSKEDAQNMRAQRGLFGAAGAGPLFGGVRRNPAIADRDLMKAALTPGHADLAVVKQATRIAARARETGTSLGHGNFGETFMVAVPRGHVAVKLPVDKDIHGKTWDRKWQRLYFLHEAGVANMLAEQTDVVPRTVFVEWKHDGIDDFALVREYGEPATLKGIGEYDKLGDALAAVTKSGWEVHDDLLVMRRPNGSLFVADVGMWHPFPKKPDYMDVHSAWDSLWRELRRFGAAQGFKRERRDNERWDTGLPSLAEIDHADDEVVERQGRLKEAQDELEREIYEDDIKDGIKDADKLKAERKRSGAGVRLRQRHVEAAVAGAAALRKQRETL